ncbi:MAG: ABC transporter permease subunit [Clostridiales bacterium]|nr:ABC transporter permease subunit [Clostridiales bacterium]
MRSVLVVLFWLGLWQLISVLLNYELLLPSPVQTAKSLLRLMGEASFYRNVYGSLSRILTGYLCAVIVGALLGALTAASGFFNAMLRPLRSFIKATPVASMILVVVLWMPENSMPGFMSFLMVLPLVWANMQESFRAADPQLVEMARLYRFGRRKTIRAVYLPQSLPALLSACTTGIGFAWKAGVAAEVLARTAHSIGKPLVESKSNLLTADMFAWTAMVVILSILLERVFAALLKLFLKTPRWEGLLDTPHKR